MEKQKDEEIKEKLKEKDEEIKELKEKLKESKKVNELTDKKYETVIKCIKGENGGRCEAGNFLDIDNIPDRIQEQLRSLSDKVNSKFPIDIFIPYKNGEPCNNQSLGNQIPNSLEEILTKDETLGIIFKNCGPGYPDRKAIMNGISYLWEWKSRYSGDGKGVRICITKFPNNCIPKYFNDCDKKYHLWVCLDYEKQDSPNSNNTKITIKKLTIKCISPKTILNTKFELSTTVDLMKNEKHKGTIIEL